MASMTEQAVPRPTSAFVTPLLTDLYQLTMSYAYWKAGLHAAPSCFELFFRRAPFGGPYTLFAGLNEVVRFVAHFRFSAADVAHLQTVMPDCDPGFWAYLRTLDAAEVHVAAAQEGAVAMPRVPLVALRGPLVVLQLMETPLLNLVNYPSLVATNAQRMRRAAGPEATLLEFGLRRAQGSDGGVSASRYAVLGGFDGTSNVLAAKLHGLTASGTHGHSFVMSFDSLDDLNGGAPADRDARVALAGRAAACRATLLEACPPARAGAPPNDGELAAFVAYAAAFPDNFLALVDTYDTLASGLVNFAAVAAALAADGGAPKGIRLDSGDLAALSRQCKAYLAQAAEALGCPALARCIVVVSDDINEKKLVLFNQGQGHAIDAFGIGTNLVTCQAQPALGCVYKLVEMNGRPRIKLSEHPEKVLLPGRKRAYRLFDQDGMAFLDVLTLDGEPAPAPGAELRCRAPFRKGGEDNGGDGVRVVTPAAVESLLRDAWDTGKEVDGARVDIPAARALVFEQMGTFPEAVLSAEEPYEVLVSEPLFETLQGLLGKGKVAESPDEHRGVGS